MILIISQLVLDKNSIYEDIIWTYTPDGVEAEDNWKAPKAS